MRCIIAAAARFAGPLFLIVVSAACGAVIALAIVGDPNRIVP